MNPTLAALPWYVESSERQVNSDCERFVSIIVSGAMFSHTFERSYQSEFFLKSRCHRVATVESDSNLISTVFRTMSPRSLADNNPYSPVSGDLAIWNILGRPERY